MYIYIYIYICGRAQASRGPDFDRSDADAVAARMITNNN